MCDMHMGTVDFPEQATVCYKVIYVIFASLKRIQRRVYRIDILSSSCILIDV